MSELTTILGEAFDVDAEEGSTDFEPLPPGQYVATIKDAQRRCVEVRQGSGDQPDL